MVDRLSGLGCIRHRCGCCVAGLGTRQAANAAKQSAETANKSLRLLHQAWLDTADWEVTEVRGVETPDEMGGQSDGRLEGLRITFNVVNNSPTPATIYHLEITDFGSGSPPSDFTVTSAVGNLITPGSKHPGEAFIQDLSRKQIVAYESGNAFTIEIHGIIHFGDTFNRKRRSDESMEGPRKRRFARVCILRRYAKSEFHQIAGGESIEPALGHEVQPG